MTYLPLNALGTQARMLGRNCKDERMAMTLQCIGVGCMLVVTATALAHLYKELILAREYGPASR